MPRPAAVVTATAPSTIASSTPIPGPPPPPEVSLTTLGCEVPARLPDDPLVTPPVADGIVSTYWSTPEIEGTVFVLPSPAAADPATTRTLTSAASRTTPQFALAQSIRRAGLCWTAMKRGYCSSVPPSTRPRLHTVPSPPPPATRRRLAKLGIVPPALVAAVLFVVGYYDGGYGLTARTVLAAGLWWLVVLGVVFGMLPRAAVPRSALVVGGLLAGLAAWTLTSVLWAASAEDAFNEFNRASIYLALFVLATVGAVRRDAGRYVDGLTAGIVAIASLALVSRLFPHLFSTRQIGVYLPNAAARLSFPVGYWNGLAILTSLGIPLCLRGALVARHRLVRGLMVALVPELVAVIYLTSSRGGAATAAVGTIVFVAATARRWSATGAALAAGTGSVLAVAFLSQRHTLVNGPLGSALAASQGRIAAPLLVGCCALSGGLLLGGERWLATRFRPSRRLAWAVVAVLVVGAATLAVLAHPVRRFDAFKLPPGSQTLSASDFATAHLLSGSGNGRWQWWTSAVHEFESAPLLGKGAGSFQFWWAAHATFTYSLKNAHSLYLEVLGELGIVGLLLVTGVFALGLATGVRRVRASDADRRVTAAGLLGVLSAFVVGAGIDWIWQLTVVSLVGIAALALLVGPATAGRLSEAQGGRARADRSRSMTALGIGALVVVWALICAQAIPWLAAQRISGSQSAARRGDLGRATSRALDAKRLEPWAGSPYLQLALVAEAEGSLEKARHWIREAISRDSEDWGVWYVASRIEREAGRPAAARADYAKAASLNPRSPLFARADGSQSG